MSSVQKKIIISLSVSLIVIGALIWVAVSPLLNVIKAAAEKYVSNQEILAGLDKKEALYRELKENYLKQTDSDDFLMVEGVLLEEDETVVFLSTLERVAQQTGNDFEIKTASSFKATEDGEMSHLVLRISLWGNFTNLIRFIANLEGNPYPPYRLTRIDTISTKRMNENLERGTREGDLETTIEMKIYTQ